MDFEAPLILQALSRCRVHGCRWRCWGLSLDSFRQLGLGVQVYEQTVHEQKFEEAARKGAPVEHEAGDPPETAFSFQTILSCGI